MSQVRASLLSLMFLMVFTECYAEQNFYGIQMKDEFWAKNLVLNIGPPANAEDLIDGPVLNASIFADALIKDISADRMDFRLNVVNETDRAVSADYQYRDYFLYMNDGRKIPLIDPQGEWKVAAIEAKSNAILSPSFGKLKIRHQDIRMIECSFDAGKVKIFLFPLSKKETIRNLKNPSPLTAVDEKKSVTLHLSAKDAKPRQGLTDWLGLNVSKAKPAAKPKLNATPKTEPPRAAIVKTKPVILPSPRANIVDERPEGVTQKKSKGVPKKSSVQQNLETAINNFKYQPSDGVSSARSRALLRDVESPAVVQSLPPKARVIDYNKTHNFITFNLGRKDGLHNDMIVNVMREGQKVAEARVRQLRDAFAGAMVLSKRRPADIRPGDLITFA